jgi:hypothetical protein
MGLKLCSLMTLGASNILVAVDQKLHVFSGKEL